MQDFLHYVLNKINFNPTKIGDAYGRSLSYQEELMLSQLEAEIGMRVEAMLDRVLAHAQPEIIMNQAEKGYIMELTAIRKSIHALIQSRGSLGTWKSSMN